MSFPSTPLTCNNLLTSVCALLRLVLLVAFTVGMVYFHANICRLLLKCKFEGVGCARFVFFLRTPAGVLYAVTQYHNLFKHSNIKVKV